MQYNRNCIRMTNCQIEPELVSPLLLCFFKATIQLLFAVCVAAQWCGVHVFNHACLCSLSSPLTAELLARDKIEAVVPFIQNPPDAL